MVIFLDFRCVFEPITACRQTPPSRGNELGNAHEIVGDEIEHEVPSDSCDAPMLGLAHRAVLLAPSEDAFGHLSTSLRDLVADVACPPALFLAAGRTRFSSYRSGSPSGISSSTPIA